MGVIIQIIDILNYQVPMKITEYVEYWNAMQAYYDAYAVCPKCGIPLAYAHQPCCGSCGQKLIWVAKRKMLSQKALLG